MKSRERLPNEPPLLDPERAIRLAREATAFVNAPVERFDEQRDLAVQMAMDAAHLALETAIDTGDPRVLDAALELAAQRESWWGEEHFEDEIASAAGVILPAITAIDNLVRSCARSKSSFLRMYTARGLGSRALRSLRGESPEAEAEVDAEAAGIVFALTKDKDADVRAAAREALGGAAPPAWATFFPRDPLASRPAAEAARLRGPLDRAAEALEEGVRKDAGPLADAIAELPDELVTPILDAWIRTDFVLSAANVTPLFERWIDLDPSGERTAAWLMGMRGERVDLEAGARLGAVLARRPTEERRTIALRLARELPGLDSEHYARVMNIDALVANGWPPEADPTPLLELALGVPIAEAAGTENEKTEHIGTLVKLALDARSDVPIEPLIDAFLTGMPGRWARLRHSLEERLLATADPRLRAHAEALLREGEGAPLTWALLYLTGAGHEPRLDPPVERLLANAARDPRLRAAMVRVESLREPAERALRAQLAAGELPHDEMFSLARSLLEREGGSLSPEEWAVVRRARAALTSPRKRARMTALLPRYPEWTEEDRAFVDALIEDHGADPLVGAALWSNLTQYEEEPGWPEIDALIARLAQKKPGGHTMSEILEALKKGDK